MFEARGCSLVLCLRPLRGTRAAVLMHKCSKVLQYEAPTNQKTSSKTHEFKKIVSHTNNRTQLVGRKACSELKNSKVKVHAKNIFPVLRSSNAAMRPRDKVITREASRLFGFTKLVVELPALISKEAGVSVQKQNTCTKELAARKHVL